MFIKNSRYYGLTTVDAKDRRGRTVQALKLRRLPVTTGLSFVVHDKDQLDILSEEQYRDAGLYWHIADANTELEANSLVQESEREITLPEKA